MHLDFNTLKVDREGAVLVVTLNRPDVLNAVDETMHDELERLFREVDDDDASRVLVITGAGRAFCAGGDVGMMRRSGGRTLQRREHQLLNRGSHLVTAALLVEKPIVAMVNGPAVGLGATLALLADAVFMADNATMSDRHVNVGLVAGDGGTALWTLLAGPMRAKEALLTGRPLPAREAYDAGLITAVVPAEDLVARALAFAAQLAELPPYAVRATKAGVNRVVSLVMRDQLDLTLAWERLSMASDDHHRAVKAFLETREASPPGS